MNVRKTIVFNELSIPCLLAAIELRFLMQDSENISIVMLRKADNVAPFSKTNLIKSINYDELSCSEQSRALLQSTQVNSQEAMFMHLYNHAGSLGITFKDSKSPLPIASRDNKLIVVNGIQSEKQSYYGTIYFVDVNYDSNATEEYLKTVPPSLVAHTHKVHESIAKTTSGHLSVNLRIPLTQSEYHDLSEGNPLPQQIKDVITFWIGSRAIELQEKIISAQRKNVFKSTLFLSDTIYQAGPGITYFNIGTSAYGVPFYKYFDVDLLCAIHLAKCMKAELEAHLMIEDSCCGLLLEDTETSGESYQRYVSSIALNAIDEDLIYFEDEARCKQPVLVHNWDNELRAERVRNYQLENNSSSPTDSIMFTGSVIALFSGNNLASNNNLSRTSSSKNNAIKEKQHSGTGGCNLS